LGVFLAEGYLSSATADELAHSGMRVAQMACQIAGSGPVRYLGSVFLPTDQACLLLFQAPCAENVTDACRLVGLPCERVTEAVISPAVLGGVITADQDKDETADDS
jgi:hypothetical protein